MKKIYKKYNIKKLKKIFNWIIIILFFPITLIIFSIELISDYFAYQKLKKKYGKKEAIFMMNNILSEKGRVINYQLKYKE